MEGKIWPEFDNWFCIDLGYYFGLCGKISLPKLILRLITKKRIGDSGCQTRSWSKVKAEPTVITAGDTAISTTSKSLVTLLIQLHFLCERLTQLSRTN
jgi:hypothetical protein